jgi:hypothetical protein
MMPPISEIGGAKAKAQEYCVEKKKPDRIYHDIEHEFDGKIHRGRFYVLRRPE